MKELVTQIMNEIHALYKEFPTVSKYDILFTISGIAEEYGIDVDDLI